MPELPRHTQQFLAFALECEALSFGEFNLKSGRVSPYFFNSGVFDSGRKLIRLASYYAQAIIDSRIGFDMLYGPAYKGIPLVTAVAIALAQEHDRDLPYCFNRKERKTHGEGGVTVGAALQGRVLIVDDVISAGTSTRESMEIIAAAGARAVAVAISLDRQERGRGRRSAIDEVRADLGLEVVSVATLASLIAYIEGCSQMGAQLLRLKAYQARYGSA